MPRAVKVTSCRDWWKQTCSVELPSKGDLLLSAMSALVLSDTIVSTDPVIQLHKTVGNLKKYKTVSYVTE